MTATPRSALAAFVFGAAVVTAFAGAPRAHADDTPMEFSDPAQERDYEELLAELRCLVCQNQSLAESHADLAQDLRREIYTMMRQGQDRDRIVAYLVDRYGDFVRYQPPLRAGTLLLWFGPFALLGAAIWILVRVARARRASPALTAAEQERVRALLGDPDER